MPQRNNACLNILFQVNMHAMKKNFLFLVCMLPCLLVKAQKKDYDTIAIMILDKMTNVIGDLSSCSYVLNISTDNTDTNAISTKFARDEVYMVGPDKMMINIFFRGILAI